MTNRCSFAFRSVRLHRTLLATLLAVCAAFATVQAGTVADLDRDNGLADAQIGAPLKAFNGLKQIEDTGRWLSYTRADDKRKFLGIDVAEITYNFFKERLYSINIDVTGKRETRRMIKELELRYGSDHSFDTRSYPKVTAMMEIREWTGTKVYCIFKSSSEFDGGVVTLLDKPIWDQLQVPKQAKEAESLSRLKGSFSNGDF